MNRALTLFVMLLFWTPVLSADLSMFNQDLTSPPLTEGAPSPGKRVKCVLPEYDHTRIYHALYLPLDWEAGNTYPVIVEYAGNKYKSGDGTVESSNLGYGITAGKGVIWLCLPYVDKKRNQNAVTWWGDVDATVEYCKQAVSATCKDYGGDPANIILAGFSRGAIACNFIGLHDHDIATLWKGFICHSHYDGVRDWGYDGADRQSAATRLARLGNRPQFISHEKSVNATRVYLHDTCPAGNFTFLDLPFDDHTDRWVLRNIPEREILRSWFWQVVRSGEK